MIIKPALAVNLKDYGPSILENKTWRISEKIDGVRRYFYKDKNENVTAYSRTGKIDPWLIHIIEHLSHPHFPKDTVYDCELVDRDLYLGRAESFILRSESAGKANQQSVNNKQDLVAVCFDMFIPGDNETGYERNMYLNQVFGNNPLSDPVILVPIYGIMNGANMNIINSLMKQVSSYKGEGLMLMDMNSMYVPGRSKTLVKVKRMNEYIGQIIDVELAKDGTKIEGGIAALICQVQGCNIPVRIGTGFSNELRRKLAIENLIGKQIEIDAFSKTRDKKGNVSLSMPVFKAFIKNIL